MKNANITTDDQFSDEVKVDLDVLGVPMLDVVGRHVYYADVVAVDQDSTMKGSVKLLQKMS